MKYNTLANGLAFENHGKKGNEPDYRGKLKVECEPESEMLVSIWSKTDKNGRTYYSVSIQEEIEQEKEHDDNQLPLFETKK